MIVLGSSVKELLCPSVLYICTCNGLLSLSYFLTWSCGAHSRCFKNSYQLYPSYIIPRHFMFMFLYLEVHPYVDYGGAAISVIFSVYARCVQTGILFYLYSNRFDFKLENAYLIYSGEYIFRSKQVMICLQKWLAEIQ